MDWFLSVDGGSTKTALLLRRADGREYRVRSGASSIKSVGECAARENLARGLDELWAASGAGPDSVTHGVFGMSGCDSPEDEAVYRAMIESLGWRPGRYTLCNDALPAFFAAADPPGVVLIAGTGSIAMGVDRQGRTVRAGGWGYGFSDLGSGWWLGCRALEQALLYCDGCRPYRPWLEEVARALGVPCLEQLPGTATTLDSADRVAALASVVLGGEPDPDKDAILARGAAHLAALVQAAAQKLGEQPDAPLRLVLTGGCMRSSRYAALVRQALPAGLQNALVPAGEDPAEGGIRMAKRAAARNG